MTTTRDPQPRAAAPRWRRPSVNITPVERAAGGRHHWMMIACCIPMIIIVLALAAAGTISIGFVLFAVLCVGMMALMMRAMDHGSRHQ